MKRLLFCLLAMVSGLSLAQPATRQLSGELEYLATNHRNGYKIYRWNDFILVDAGAETGRFALISPEIIAELRNTASNQAEKGFASYAIVPAKNIVELRHNLQFWKIFNINCRTNMISDNDDASVKPFALNQATQLHQTAANLACVALEELDGK